MTTTSTVTITDTAPALVRRHAARIAPGLTGEQLTIQDTTPRRLIGHSGVRPFMRMDVTWPHPHAPEGRSVLWAKRTYAAAAEFTEMERIYSALETASMQATMPRPIACDPDTSIIVTTFHEGRSMRQTVFRAACIVSPWNPALESLATTAGHWLRRYHELLATGDMPAYTEASEGLGAAVAASGRFNAAEKLAITGWLNETPPLLERFQGFDCLTAPHNDFTLRNILWTTPETITILDWDPRMHPEFPRTGSGWCDTTAFMLNLMSLRRFAPLVSVRRLAKIGDAFLSGYNPSVSPADCAAHLWLYALQYYLGTLGDRPLYERYSRRLFSRFMRQLHEWLVEGPVRFGDLATR